MPKSTGFFAELKPPTLTVYRGYAITDDSIEATDLNPKEIVTAPSFDDLFQDFARIETEDQIETFVSKHGFLTRRHNIDACEPLSFFIKEVADAKKYVSLHAAAIASENKGITALKRRITMTPNPNYDKSDPLDFGTEYICIFDGTVIDQTPHVKHAGGVETISIPHSPFGYTYNGFDPGNPIHWRKTAIDIVLRGIHERTKTIFLGFLPVTMTRPTYKSRPWEVSTKPCLICEDLLAAMYFAFYLRLTAPHGERPCQKCTVMFKPVTHKEKYCFDCRFTRYSDGTRFSKYPAQARWNKQHRVAQKTKQTRELGE